MFDSYLNYQKIERKQQKIHPSKIPPKLTGDYPNYRPSNKNYVDYRSKFEKYKQRKGQRMWQSLAVISYGTDHTSNNKNNSLVRNFPRYLQISSNTERDNAFQLKKRMLMSKYVHQEFDPIFETEFTKAYLQGIEEIGTIPNETVADLVMRIGKYKGKVHRQVHFR